MPEAIPIITSTGKRKTAIARVRMKLGTGNVIVNGRPMAEYFPREVLHMRLLTPFEAVSAEGRYDVTASITGGGIAGQADAALPRHRARAREGGPDAPPFAQEEGPAHARRAQEGAEEVRPARRAPSLPVLQAVVPACA